MPTRQPFIIEITELIATETSGFPTFALEKIVPGFILVGYRFRVRVVIGFEIRLRVIVILVVFGSGFTLEIC